MRNRIIWDFLYDHVSLFTAQSLRLAFQRTGFAVERIEYTFNGQYLWLETHVKGVNETWPIANETLPLAITYASNEQRLQDIWLTRLYKIRKNGKVALWGVGAKGATFANLVDPQGILLDCVVDLNPNKQGCFIPGSGHPIVSPFHLPTRGVRDAILMNPKYREENLQLLTKAAITVNLIDWSE